MPIVFIAVQCVQCSTMQVKQQTKNSKWVCAICNQWQSVMRIHARGYIARDLRNFVQQFNLSRSKKESGGGDSYPAASDVYINASEMSRATSPVGQTEFSAKRRFDWSEYLDPEEDGQCADDGEGSDAGALFTQDFTTKQPTKKLNYPSAKKRAVEQTMDPMKKLSRSHNPEGFANRHNAQSAALEKIDKKSSSKWSEYLDEDEEDRQNSSGDDQKHFWGF